MPTNVPSVAKPASSTAKRVLKPSAAKAAKPVTIDGTATVVADTAALKPVPAVAAPIASAAPAIAAAATPATTLTSDMRARKRATQAALRLNRTAFGGSASPRDDAYTAFFAGFAKAAADGIVTLDTVLLSGRAPDGIISNKSIDGGAINRLRAAGRIVLSGDDADAFTFTDAGKALSHYTRAVAVA